MAGRISYSFTQFSSRTLRRIITKKLKKKPSSSSDSPEFVVVGAVILLLRGIKFRIKHGQNEVHASLEDLPAHVGVVLLEPFVGVELGRNIRVPKPVVAWIFL